MSYEVLTGRLTELDAATRSDKHPNLVDEDEKFGLLYHKCSSECVPYHEAVDAFHAPAHEYAAVTLALIRRMGGYDVNEDHWDLCETVLYSDKPCNCGKDALDALQAAMVVSGSEVPGEVQ